MMDGLKIAYRYFLGLCACAWVVFCVTAVMLAMIIYISVLMVYVQGGALL